MNKYAIILWATETGVSKENLQKILSFLLKKLLLVIYVCQISPLACSYNFWLTSVLRLVKIYYIYIEIKIIVNYNLNLNKNWWSRKKSEPLFCKIPDAQNTVCWKNKARRMIFYPYNETIFSYDELSTGLSELIKYLIKLRIIWIEL